MGEDSLFHFPGMNEWETKEDDCVKLWVSRLPYLRIVSFIAVEINRASPTTLKRMNIAKQI